MPPTPRPPRGALLAAAPTRRAASPPLRDGTAAGSPQPPPPSFHPSLPPNGPNFAHKRSPAPRPPFSEPGPPAPPNRASRPPPPYLQPPRPPAAPLSSSCGGGAVRAPAAERAAGPARSSAPLCGPCSYRIPPNSGARPRLAASPRPAGGRRRCPGDECGTGAPHRELLEGAQRCRDGGTWSTS